MHLAKLFNPFHIGRLEIQNRIVMPPMATNYATPEGFVTDPQVAYYVERAKGGVGYITVEHTGILQQGKASPNMLLISTDEHTAHIKRLVERVHREGGKIVVQVNHAGRQTSPLVTGSPIVGPSPIAVSPEPDPSKANVPRELSVKEIEEITEAFAMAAHRVKQAGADGVELHMAHGYLLCSFLSRFSNLRKDRYGGDIANRSRFSLEVLKAVRSQVGSDFPIICRLSGDEYVQNGLKLEETKQIAAILEREGADALHISACNAASVYLNHPPYYVPEGVFVHLAQAIKAEVSIPVIAVGRIRRPLMAEEIIREGRADLVSMGRALIADPQLPKKAEQGRLDEIVPCISCNRCIQNLRKGALRCAVNPETGNETQFKLSKTQQPKKIWIVGGGPGGLKAAEIAARRGHQVKVIEKGDQLGGRMRLASIPPEKAVLKEFIDYLEKKVKSLGVTLELGKEFTADMLSHDEPQAVIVATGAVPHVPDWKGVNDSEAVTVDEVLLSGGAQVGEKVLVLGGGGVGAEAADFLSEMGKEVTIVEMMEEIATDLVTHLQHYLHERLREKGVSFLTSTRVEQLGKGYAVVEDSSGTRQIKGFDTIVLALGATPDDRIAKSLRGKIRQLHVIGDAAKPREVLEAVYEGEEIALKI